MVCRLIEVWVTVDNEEDIKDIADDLSEILGDYGVINSINITDKILYN